MNRSPSNELLRQMERATAIGPVDDALADSSLDPETARLRAGWQGLSDLLEAAQPRTEIRLSEPVVGNPEPANARYEWRNVLMVAGSLAASLVLILSGFYLPRVPRDLTRARNDRPAEVNRPSLHSGELASEKQQGESGHQSIEVTVAHDRLDWQDDLDDQLLDAWGQVYRLQTAATTLDARHDSIVDSMQKLRQDLADDNTLYY